MNIVVCIKQVPDTKGGVKFNPDGTLDRAAMLAIMNPDDKAGLEAALRIKDETGAKVTVLTMGLPKADAVLREAMAMGADDAILVTDRVLGGADTWATSTTIAGALRNLDYDLIITGRQAIDGDTAQVGPQIAEIRMPGEITLIGSKDSGQCFLHGRNIPCLRPHQYRLRHTTGDIVHFQLLIQWIKEGVRDGFKGVHLFQILCQVFITVGKQEFIKGHRVNLHKVDLTDRKRRGFRQSNT